jgi:hypothetical protein
LLSKSVATALFLLLVLGLFARPVGAQNSDLNVTSPRLQWGQISPILAHETPIVWVNVTSAYSIANVTLYYLAMRSDCCPPEPTLSGYTAIQMLMRSGNSNNGTYMVEMPTVANYSFVWGFARAFDDRGDLAVSQLNMMYLAFTPNPRSSYLSLDLFVRHIDPAALLLNLTVQALLVNAASYGPGFLRSPDGLLWIPVAESVTKYSFTNRLRTVSVYYSHGHPELYPFDRYNYTFSLLLPPYLNDSGIDFEGHHFVPGVVYQDFIYTVPETGPERLDNSAWKIHSTIQYFPSSNLTASYPSLHVTIILERELQLSFLLLLVPTYALYLILGFSILVRSGKDELSNRLLLYLTVFGFVYTLLTSVKGSATAPITYVPSLSDRLVLAVIPCSLVFMCGSIVASYTQIRGARRLQTHPMRWDYVAVVLSELILFGVTFLSLTEWVTGQGFVTTPYPLLYVGVLGWIPFLALASGVIIIRFGKTARITAVFRELRNFWKRARKSWKRVQMGRPKKRKRG